MIGLDLWKMRFEDPLTDAESFALDDDSNIIDIGQKLKSLDGIQGQFMGLLKVENAGKAIIEEIINRSKENFFKFDSTFLIKQIIDNGFPIKAVPNDLGWCEIDSPQDLMIAERLVKSGIIKMQ